MFASIVIGIFVKNGGGREAAAAIFGRISHHPFGPRSSREFATLHISCRKQQFSPNGRKTEDSKKCDTI